VIGSGARVLVTGAAGFIGSHLCEALVGLGATVTAMVHYNSRNHAGNLEFVPPAVRSAMRIVAGNIEDSDFVARQVQAQDVVFHLAALIGIPYSYVAPLSYVRTNVEGTLNVLEAARRFGVARVVHTSTSEAYGTAIFTPMNESHPLQGQSPYSASKIGADKVAESYHRSFGVPVATIRPFNTYGPRQSARAVVPTIISQVLLGGEVRLGSLEPVRDLTYVADTVDAFLKIAASDQAVGQVINVGTGRGVSVADLAGVILRLMKSSASVTVDADRVRPADSEVLKLICDPTTASERIGWKARVTLEQGLERTIAFVSAHADLYAASSYVI
jgi:NAD dependent epimerase/dehydratase